MPYSNLETGPYRSCFTMGQYHIYLLQLKIDITKVVIIMSLSFHINLYQPRKVQIEA
jgi:hypothetical protein